MASERVDRLGQVAVSTQLDQGGAKLIRQLRDGAFQEGVQRSAILFGRARHREQRRGLRRVELGLREALLLPPFGKLAAVIISGPDEARTKALAKKFTGLAPRADGIEILGPSEAPIARLRGRYRQRLLIQSEPDNNLSAYMQSWRGRMRLPSKYKLQVDIDPQSFM